MIKLENKDYIRVIPLIKTHNELSVFSVIEGKVSGEIYVDCLEEITSVLIITSECNYVAGDPNNKEFNKFIKEKLDFWDTLTPDTFQWEEQIKNIHKDKYIRKYNRHRYILEIKNEEIINNVIPVGYVLERINPKILRESKYVNANKVIDWMENWESDDAFTKYAVGTYLRNENTIVSWSLSDCSSKESVAIGIYTDERYRNKGFAKIVVSETIKECIKKGYKIIEWLCVDCNKGSNALATTLGFKLKNIYPSYSPFAPIENILDLTEEEWNNWAEYFELSSKDEPRLLLESLFTYVKANNTQKVNELINKFENKKDIQNQINDFVSYLHTINMASNFKNEIYYE